MAVIAILFVPPTQANYGIDDASCIAAVKKVFDELDMRGVYKAYEDRTYADIIASIEAVSTEGDTEVDFTDPGAEKLPRKFFIQVVDLFHKRQK